MEVVGAEGVVYCSTATGRWFLKQWRVAVGRLSVGWRSQNTKRSARARPQAKRRQKAKKRAYGTPDSHVVPHRSTDRACSGLTAQFGRDTVLFTEYGRRRVQKGILRSMKSHACMMVGMG